LITGKMSQGTTLSSVKLKSGGEGPSTKWTVEKSLWERRGKGGLFKADAFPDLGNRKRTVGVVKFSATNTASIGYCWGQDIVKGRDHWERERNTEVAQRDRRDSQCPDFQKVRQKKTIISRAGKKNGGGYSASKRIYEFA